MRNPLRVYISGTNGIHANVLRPEFTGHGACHLEHRRLTDVIGGGSHSLRSKMHDAGFQKVKDKENVLILTGIEILPHILLVKTMLPAMSRFAIWRPAA